MNKEQDNSIYFLNNDREEVLGTSRHFNTKIHNVIVLNKDNKDDLSTKHKCFENFNASSLGNTFLQETTNKETKKEISTPTKLTKVFVEEKEGDSNKTAGFRFRFTSSDKKVRLEYSNKSGKTKKNNENDIQAITVNLCSNFQNLVEEKNLYTVDEEETGNIKKFPLISSCSSDSVNNTDKDSNDSKDCEVNSQLIRNFKSKTKIDIPLDKIDDEKFKKKEIKKIRHPYFKDTKSICKKDLVRKRPDYLDNAISIHGNRRKVSHSVKKIYNSEVGFINPVNNEKVYFRMFNDAEIGFRKDWQNLIHELQFDEDVPSEDDLIIRAKVHLLNELKGAIDQVTKDHLIVNNVNYLNN